MHKFIVFANDHNLDIRSRFGCKRCSFAEMVENVQCNKLVVTDPKHFPFTIKLQYLTFIINCSRPYLLFYSAYCVCRSPLVHIQAMFLDFDIFERRFGTIFADLDTVTGVIENITLVNSTI